MASNEQIAHERTDTRKAKAQPSGDTPSTRPAPRASSAGSTAASASHTLTSPSANTDAAFPVFRNQVAGHSPLLWHKGTICKPLNPTEYFFYSQLIAGELSALTPFAPKFYGILDMSYIPVEFQKQQVEKDQRKAEKRKVLQEREAKLLAQQAAAAKAAVAPVVVQTVTSTVVQSNRNEFSIHTTAVATASISGSFTSSSLTSSSLPGLSSSQSIPVSLGSATGTRGEGENAMSAAMVASASATPPAASPQHQMNTWVLTCQKRQKASARSADVTSQAHQQLEEQMHSHSQAKYATLPASFEMSPEAQRKVTTDEHLATGAHPDSSSHSVVSQSYYLNTPSQAATSHTSSAPASADPPQSSHATPVSEPLPQYIVLEDLTFAYDRPCILDLKLGTRQHGINDSPKKIASKIEKCLKTTSGKLGLRLCLTQDHSVLVRYRGWVRIDQVKKGEEVWAMAGLGKENGVWSEVTDEVVQPLGENEELVHFSSEHVELLCTRQHAMWTVDPQLREWTNEPAEKVSGQRLVRLAAEPLRDQLSTRWQCDEACVAWFGGMPLASWWGAFMGTVLATGSIFTQPDPGTTGPEVKYLTFPRLECMDFIGDWNRSKFQTLAHPGWTVKEPCVVALFEPFFSHTRDRAERLKWIFDKMPQLQAEDVLENFIDADLEHFRRDMPVVSAFMREVLMTFAAVACKSITCRAKEGEETWEVLLNAVESARTPLASKSEHKKLIPSHQHRQKTVYCITVKAGNFFVRRDGTPRCTPMFVGNCGMQVYHPTRKPAVTPMTSIAESADGNAPPEPADGKFVYYDKYYGRSLNEDTFLKTLKLFFWNGEKLLLHIILLFLERLDKLRKTLELRQMNKYRFYSSSLLMVYEGQTSKPTTGAATLTEGGWNSTRNESTEDAPEAPLSANTTLSGPNPRPDHYPALSSLNSSHRLHEIVDRSLNISGSGSNGGLPRSHSIDFHQVTQQSAPQSLEAAAAATAAAISSALPPAPKPAKRQTSNTRAGDTRSISSPTAIVASPVQLHAAPNLTPSTSSGSTPGKSPTPTPAAPHLDSEDLLELHQILSREVARIESIRRGYGGIVEQKQEEEKIEEAKRQRLLAAAEERARDAANGVVTAQSTVHAKVVHHAADSQAGLMSQGPTSTSRTSSSSTHLTPTDGSTPSVGVFSPSSHVSYVHVSSGSGDGQRFNGHEAQPSAEPANPLHPSPQPPSPLPVPHVSSPSTAERSLSKEPKLGGPYASSPAILPSAPALGAPSTSAAPKFYNRVRKTTHAQARERARLKGNIDIRLIDYAQVVKWERGEERAIVDVDARTPTPGGEPHSTSADVPAVDQGVGDPGLLIGVNNLIYFISNIVTQEINTMLAQEQARADALAASSSTGRSVTMAPQSTSVYDATGITRTRTPPLSEALEGASAVRAQERRPELESDVAADAPALIDSSSHTAAFSSSHVPKSKAIIIPLPAAIAPVAQRGSPNKSAGTPPGTASKRQTM
jgi:invasion protein IalB